MFEVPDAKRVKRDELLRRSSSRSTSPSQPEDEEFDDKGAVLLRMREVNGSITEDVSKSTQELAMGSPLAGHTERQLDDEGFAFKLFATPSKEDTTNSVPHIRLDLSIDDAGKLHVPRSPSYYFAAPASSYEREMFEASTVTGQDVLVGAHTPWHGYMYPWKVLHLKGSALKESLQEGLTLNVQHSSTGADKTKRLRKGKKARIKSRQKLRIQEAHSLAVAKVKDEEIKQAGEKEQYLRDKKTRMNRRKQQKKREKARQQKSVETPSEAVVDPP